MTGSTSVDDVMGPVDKAREPLDASADREPKGARYDYGALSTRALRLRDRCLVALSHRESRRPPNATELSKLRDNLGLQEAWFWWANMHEPTQAVRAAVVPKPRRRRDREWRRLVVVLLATCAWLLVPTNARALAGPSSYDSGLRAECASRIALATRGSNCVPAPRSMSNMTNSRGTAWR